MRNRPPYDMHRLRVHGTNGSFPVTAARPQQPRILNLVEDVAEDEPELVFGQYPRGFLAKILPYLRCERNEVLHVCSGTLRRGEGIRVDIRPAAKPDVLADGRELPFADATFKAVLLDPPYTRQYAADLYGVEYPRPKHLLAEASRVVKPCGRIGFVHYLVPFPPPRCRIVRVLGLSTGMGFAMRAVSIWEREQDELSMEGTDE